MLSTESQGYQCWPFFIADDADQDVFLRKALMSQILNSLPYVRDLSFSEGLTPSPRVPRCLLPHIPN